MDEAAMPLAAPPSKEYASCVSKTKQLFKTLYSNTVTLAASGQPLIYSKYTGQQLPLSKFGRSRINRFLLASLMLDDIVLGGIHLWSACLTRRHQLPELAQVVLPV
jgi:hypothetical protein